MHPAVEATLKGWEKDEESVSSGMIVQFNNPHTNPFNNPVNAYGVVCHVIPPSVRKVGLTHIPLTLEERTIVRIIGQKTNYSMAALSMAKFVDELPADYEIPSWP